MMIPLRDAGLFVVSYSEMILQILPKREQRIVIEALTTFKLKINYPQMCDDESFAKRVFRLSGMTVDSETGFQFQKDRLFTIVEILLIDGLSMEDRNIFEKAFEEFKSDIQYISR
jgi:hypothetical protein